MITYELCFMAFGTSKGVERVLVDLTHQDVVCRTRPATTESLHCQMFCQKAAHVEPRVSEFNVT